MDRNNKEDFLNKTGTYKYCFVPECKSTTSNNPTKLFISVPKGSDRKKWIEITRREPSTSLKSSLFCCEDHFKVDEDLENYTRIKLDPGANIILKKGVLPRFFSCQEDRKRAFPAATRPGAKKLKTLQILKEIDQEQKNQSNNDNENSTIADNDRENNRDEFVYDKNISCELPAKNAKDVGVQVCIKPHFRSASVNCNLYEENQPQRKNVACSPLKVVNKFSKNIMISRTISRTSTSTIKTGDGLLSSEEYMPTTQSSDETSADKILLHQKQAAELQIARILKKPKSYIGVNEEAFFIVRMLSEESKSKLENVCMTLEKIKLDLPFNILADEYEIGLTNATTIYRKTVPLLAHFLKNFIIWPSRETIISSLPLAFRARYKNVQSIIDCFEIQIQKPTNALYQALTWSDYKKCNTVKYLISSTPDGTINFISQGFGGRASDLVIVEESNYLEKLPFNCAVMADRGFKHIEPLLKRKNCFLVRPPSVSSNKKPTKSEVMETKRIASLRIHIERVIKRYREFSLLKPHATVPIKSLDLIDDVIIIASALINLQTPVIAQV